MRVTTSSFPDTLVDQLSRLSLRQSRLQNQAATGQRVTLPDDDPVAMRRVLDLQGEAGSVAQYQKNIARHQELASATYAPIKSLRSIIDRASELATQVDDLDKPEDLQIYAVEINQLLEQALQVANSQSRGNYLFAGTKNQAAAYGATRDAGGSITAVTYQGNQSVAESEVAAGIELSAQVPGSNVSGSGARGLFVESRTGADLFGHLIALRDRLQAGDARAVMNESLGELGADEENVLYHMGANGAIQARLETTNAIMKERALSLQTMVSKEADADLAQTLVRLNEVQTAYQAALQSGGSILTRSLMDYLR